MTVIASVSIFDFCRAQTNVTNPPQVQGWEAVTDFANQYPGQKLTIQNDDIVFSAAGSYYVKYVGIYKTNPPAQIFEVEKILPKTPADIDLLCRTKLTFMVLTYLPNDPTLSSPSLTFDLFSGSAAPDPKTAGTTRDNCASFTYASP